jgi:hypothetical protein
MNDNPPSPDVRSADPVVHTRLIGNRNNSELTRAEDISVDWMFPPPNFLSYPGSFSDVCTYM